MYKWLLIVLLPAIFAARALFAGGYIPTHDGEYHLIRFYEFAKMLSAGNFFPRWASTLNSGYGVPLFNFHYPFPNYIGSLYHFLGASFPDAVKLVLATGFLSAVSFCFLWLSKIFDKRSAALGTIVFSFIPYWFVDIYVRGAVGEVLGIAFVMVALCSIERKWATGLALAVGFLMISHNIMSLIFLPVLFLYLIIRQRSFIPFLLLGISLASYFWIPAIFEKQYVMGLNTVNFRDHFPYLLQLVFPFWGTGFSQPGQPADEMSFQIGLLPLLVLLTGVVLLLKKNTKDTDEKRSLALFFLAVCCIAFFLMLENSTVFWELIPLLSYVQYPWRLLSEFLPATAFIAAYTAFRIKHIAYSILIIIGAVLFAYSYTKPVTYAPRSDAYYLSRSNFTDGTSSMGNTFSTRWTDWKSQRPKEKVELIDGKGSISSVIDKPGNMQFTVIVSTPSGIRINTLYYPGWEVMIDHKKVPIDYLKDGTLTFSVNPGRWDVVAHFRETPLRKIADSISIISLAGLLGWGILKFYAHRH